MVYYRILNIVPCVIQLDLVVYPFFLYILNFIRAVLLVLRSFLERVVLYVVVVLVCPWQEVSSGPS